MCVFTEQEKRERPDSGIDVLHHRMTEHIWRAGRAAFILLGTSLWLFSDGYNALDFIILGFYAGAVAFDQLHGIICRGIEKMLGWKEDFDKWE